MKTFEHTCITFEDFCEEFGVDRHAAMYKVEQSDISFGTNSDTLVRTTEMCRILGIGFPLDTKVKPSWMVSLGS